MPPAKFGDVLAYIHNNPVRANVVALPGQSDWTSHRAYVGTADVPPWLHVAEGFERSGLTRETIDTWVRGTNRDSSKSESEVFEELQLEEALESDAREPSIDPRELVEVTARMLGLSVDALCSRRKQARHVRARRVVVMCADQLGITGTSCARALRISPQCVSKILTQPRVEELERDLMEDVMRDVQNRQVPPGHSEGS